MTCPPRSCGAPSTRRPTSWPTTSRTSRRTPSCPRSSPGSSGAASTARRQRTPSLSRRSCATCAAEVDPERHALAASRLLRLLPGQRLGHRPPRRARLERPQRQRLPVAHVARGRGARGHHGRLAARSAWACPRPSTASSTTPPRSAAWRRSQPPVSTPPATPRRPASRASATAAHLRLVGGALLDRAGGHDPGRRPGRRAQGRRSTPTRAMDPDGLRRAIAEDRDAGWRPAAVVATIGTTSTTAIDPVADIADVCAAEGALAPRRRGLRRAGRPHPDDAPPLRGLGARRLDRRQPAQVAVHALRLLAPADAPDGHACETR